MEKNSAPTEPPPAEPRVGRPTPLPTWSFIGIIVVVQVVDRLIGRRATFDRFTQAPSLRDTLIGLQVAGDVVFLAVAVVAVVVAAVGSRPRWINAVLVAYLAMATINLSLSVTALVVTADRLRVVHLTLLWDVGLVYVSTVLVFALWYRLLDCELRGGAFEFPTDPARPDRQPGWIDYVFLSFNTNATFGPTAEVVHARTAKVVMMVQTVISLLVLVVLVARIVGLGG